MIDSILDGLLDTLKLLPYLFITFLILELIEHKLSRKTQKSISKHKRLGPVLAGIIGGFPQCGFSAMASDPEEYEKVDFYSKLIFDGFKLSNFDFENYLVLDRRTANFAKKYVENADMIFLSGGDTFVENEFFKDIKLKELLENYQGIIVGQSAGSINLASNVYNSPEDGNETDIRTIYFNGLGLSDINIEPHFELNDESFNQNEQYQRRHILKESNTRSIYALCDGAHIIETDEEITVYGESYLIKDGNIIPLCKDKESYIIYASNKLKK